MNSVLRCSLLPIFALALSQVMGGAIFAGQSAAVEPAARPAKTQLKTNSTAALVPPPVKSPVQFFRELLDMTPAERTQALTNRTTENRKLILAKIREYRSLSQNERELRLRATELEWYLVPLMRTPETNRAGRLAALPEDYRKMIHGRLEEWDKLPAEVRKELLDGRESIRLYLQMTSGVSIQTNSQLAGRPPVEQGLKKILAMSAADRQKLIHRFNQYFDLTDREKQKALRTLSSAEQQQIDRTLGKFRDLTPHQRAQCIRSFEEFARMTPAERQQFLKNAERWIIMTPDQRQAWRDLVEKVSVTPPTFAASPRPPAVPGPDHRAAPATNGD